MENNGILMPEVIIQKAVVAILGLLKSDYQAESDKTKTLLYYFFKLDQNDKQIVFNTMDYYAQAVELFNERKIQVNMGYNLETADIPNIHILLPSENSKPLTIGADENYRPPIEIEDGDDTFSRPVFTQTFNSNYQLMITSPNVFEVLLIYNALKMGFLSLYENLEFHGLRDIKTGGQDIHIQKDLVPTHIFHRNLSLAFFYEMNTPRHFKEKLVKSFTSSGIID